MKRINFLIVLMLGFVYLSGFGHTFTDITESHLGNTGSAPHSITFADIDGDGDPDLYMTMYRNVARPDLLLINQGDGSFVEEAVLRGADDRDGGSHGACFTDLDNDGDYDLFNGSTRNTALTGSDHNNVLINNGNGYFEDITESIASISRRKENTRTVLSLDIDGDGYLDLFGVTGYKGSADENDKNEIFHNLHNLDFESVEAGDCYRAPVGQGATDTDYDGDGDMDIIAANRSGDLNILRNRGNGVFDLVDPDDILFPKVQVRAMTAGVEYTCQAGDGISMGDVDNDGDLDMLLVTFDAEEAHLYFNRGDGTFSLSDQSWSGVEGYMGNFADLDNDGDLDLIFAGTRWVRLNDGTGYFSKGIPNGLQNIQMGSSRALSFADVDQDGDLDFAMADKEVRASLVRNDLDTLFHWLQVQLVAPNGQAGAFGSRVWVHSSGSDSVLIGMREARSNLGYLAQNEPVLHFGLNVHETVDVTVRFLDGTVVRKENVNADQKILTDGSDMDLYFSCRVFLGGPYEKTLQTMRNDLQTQQILPLKSPYPQHDVTVSALPETTTDWVLLEIYADTSSSPVVTQSCLVRTDGTLISAESLSPWMLLDVPRGTYFVRIQHRNHVTVTSPPQVFYTEQKTFDFTTQPLSGQKQVVTASGTVYVMQWGDADGSGWPDEDDLTTLKQQMLQGIHGYSNADVNLDGHVYASDYAKVKEVVQ